MKKNKIRPLNGWAFVIRDKEETKQGEDVTVFLAEKWRSKNRKGTVYAVAENDLVKAGDRILLPHFGVEEMVIGGQSMAMVNIKNLYAKLIPGEDGEKIIPINRYVRIKKCYNDHIRDVDERVLVYLTDQAVEDTNWVEIINVAEDCKKIKRDYIGYLCEAPEMSDQLQRIGFTNDFMLHEDKIEWLVVQ